MMITNVLCVAPQVAPEIKYLSCRSLEAFSWFIFSVLSIYRDTAMASITERAQRMEKDLRETTAKHDRAAAELQVSRVH